MAALAAVALLVVAAQWSLGDTRPSSTMTNDQAPEPALPLTQEQHTSSYLGFEKESGVLPQVYRRKMIETVLQH
jgi:hypothetical protein